MTQTEETGSEEGNLPHRLGTRDCPSRKLARFTWPSFRLTRGTVRMMQRSISGVHIEFMH